MKEAMARRNPKVVVVLVMVPMQQKLMRDVMDLLFKLKKLFVIPPTLCHLILISIGIQTQGPLHI
jgi:hypothetical protein